MDDKDAKIRELTLELARWRGRAIEAAELACVRCRETDPSLCRHCRMEKIRQEAGGQ